MTKESVGQRGKIAEKLVEATLKAMNNRTDFAYWRLPDSRSARSYLVAQPGDFCFYSGDYAGIIEVKSTEHACRLTKAHVSQLPTLNKLFWAGACSLIIVNHSIEETWRCVKPELLEIGLPSWDLSEYPEFGTAKEALISSGYFD